jgi:hypothetical protein
MNTARMKMRPFFGAVLVATLVVIGWVAVQAVSGGGAHSVRKTAVFDTSNVKAYSSLQDLRADASSVAVIDPSSVTHVETINGIPFTVTTATVQETVSGQTLPSTIELRQTGDGTDPNWPLVSSSATYLAYLQPFHFSSGGQVGDQYVVVGGLQGLFSHTPRDLSATGSTSFHSVGDHGPGVPSTVTVDQARAS